MNDKNINFYLLTVQTNVQYIGVEEVHYM